MKLSPPPLGPLPLEMTCTRCILLPFPSPRPTARLLPYQWHKNHFAHWISASLIYKTNFTCTKKCTSQTSACSTRVFMTNEMHNSYNHFLFHSFLSALHVSKESSRSSSEARHNILYYTVWYNRYNCAGESSFLDATRLACTIVRTVLCNTVYYAVLLMMND